MLKSNETLPEIEQLNRHEFDLDIEEQMRLQTEADQEVERVSLYANSWDLGLCCLVVKSKAVNKWPSLRSGFESCWGQKAFM